ncbi:MAG: DsbA family protein [Terriglobia bacterium]
MSLKHTGWKWLVAAAAAMILPGLMLSAKTASRASLSESILHQKLLNFFTTDLLVPPKDLQAGPFESSQNPAYYECVVTINNNGKVTNTPVSICKNGRYVGLTPMYYLGPDTNAEIARSVRERFKLGTEWQLTVGPLHASVVPGFLETTITAERNGQKQNPATFYVTADKRFAVLGQLFILRTPAEVERLINVQNQPTSGPANAPVTIVEYADLECPTCGRLQPFLENELLPRYGNKVRIIYKEFPLPQHDWSREAAIANQCAYEIDPPSYAHYRTSIFAHQNEINVTNVRDMLLQLGEQVGIDRLKLAGCLDSKASLPRVEAGYREGNKLQVMYTPTLFINGVRVAGYQPPDHYYRIIDEDLGRAK